MADSSRIFELRTYRAAPGRLAALQERFRQHTLGLFERHGFDVIGFWTPVDVGGQPNETLVYLLAFADRDAARRAWTAFAEDPDWAAAKASSETDGP